MFDTLVLAGGSLKGIGMLGSLQYFYDMKQLQHMNVYIGTSVGAIICMLLICDYTPLDILMTLIANKKVLSESYNATKVDFIGLLSGKGGASINPIMDIIETMVVKRYGYIPTLLQLYEAEKKTLYACTYNYTQNQPVYLSHMTHPEMSVVTAMHMSSNIPLLFKPYLYEDCYYIDGCVYDNLPTQLIPVDSNPLIINISYNYKTEIAPLHSYVYNLYKIISNSSAEWKIHFLKPGTYTLIDLKLSDETLWFSQYDTIEFLKLFSIGYNKSKLEF